MGPEVDRFEDTTESLLEERIGMGSALRGTLLADVEGRAARGACAGPGVEDLTDSDEYGIDLF